MIVGVISDTHGVLNRQALEALEGVQHIIHAGDIGNPDIIQTLEKIAPLTAVRGNMDSGVWSNSLPAYEMITLNQSCFYILHNLDRLDLEPQSAGIDIVVSGHTHFPEIKSVNQVLYFNPGSASSSRYGGPLAIGKIRLFKTYLEPEIIQLTI
jgi:putative phosphoesterase